MKLLDWMHQKIRKGGTIPFNDRSITGPIGSCYKGLSKHDDIRYAAYNTPNTRNWTGTSNGVEDWNTQHEIEEESFAESPVIFQGFLSIGFLGLEPIVSEPMTPTFNNLTEGQFAVTENELRFINEELEKILENEVNEENTTVSSGRNSQASVISLASMHVERDGLLEQEEEEHITLCPLQHYLFGSTIELPHSKEEVKKKMSLRELFYENEQSEESPDDECKAKTINTKEQKKFNVLSIKKFLKKLKSQNPLRPASGELTAASKRNKFNKILKMIRRKVHPEKDSDTHFISDGELDGKFRRSTNDVPDTGERLDLSSTAEKSDRWAEYKEQWIKTDTDYFVLEL